MQRSETVYDTTPMRRPWYTYYDTRTIWVVAYGEKGILPKGEAYVVDNNLYAKQYSLRLI